MTTSIYIELQCLLSKNGKSLWCEGLPKRNDSEGCICLDSDSDNEEVIKPKKRKVKPESNAYEDKVKRVDSLANELKRLHAEKYNKIQLKLWAEALDSGKHQSKDIPPHGTIWSGERRKTGKKGTESVDVMASAFTHMANTVASAFGSPAVEKGTSPIKDSPSFASTVSPGRRIDYQEKLLKQLDMLHAMFERGALTSSQFEKRRDSLLTQLDSLD